MLQRWQSSRTQRDELWRRYKRNIKLRSCLTITLLVTATFTVYGFVFHVCKITTSVKEQYACYGKIATQPALHYILATQFSNNRVAAGWRPSTTLPPQSYDALSSPPSHANVYSQHGQTRIKLQSSKRTDPTTLRYWNYELQRARILSTRKCAVDFDASFSSTLDKARASIREFTDIAEPAWPTHDHRQHKGFCIAWRDFSPSHFTW